MVWEPCKCGLFLEQRGEWGQYFCYFVTEEADLLAQAVELPKVGFVGWAREFLDGSC